MPFASNPKGCRSLTKFWPYGHNLCWVQAVIDPNTQNSSRHSDNAVSAANRMGPGRELDVTRAN